MPEPRAGLPSGPIPYSSNTPFQSVLDTEGRHFLAPDQLAEVFSAKGVDIRKPTILSCGMKRGCTRDLDIFVVDNPPFVLF